MELFSEEVINSICDLKDENEEVISVLHIYENFLDDIITDIKKHHQESSLFFGNADELKHYLTHFIEKWKYEEKLNLKEKRLRVVKCECGCVWNILVEPDTPRVSPNYWLDRHWDRDPESFPMESVMKRALRFRCSICEGISLVRNATKIYKIESEKIPPHALRKY